MENNRDIKKSSKPVSLIFLIPALILSIVSFVMAVAGLGLIPLLPAAAGILLCLISIILFRKSFRIFTRTIVAILVSAILISFIRSSILGNKVAADKSFDSVLVNTRQGIDNDLKDALGGDVFGSEGKRDTVSGR
jgi:hypothetical protein